MVRACEYDGLSLKRLNYMKKDFADVIKILNQLTKRLLWVGLTLLDEPFQRVSKGKRQAETAEGTLLALKQTAMWRVLSENSRLTIDPEDLSPRT